MKYIISEKDVKGERAEPPYSRCLKHLVTPWIMGTHNLWMGMSVVDPKSSSNPHSHKNEEIFYVVSGKGEVKVKNRRCKVKTGTCILVPSGAVHQLINRGEEPLKVLAVASPPFLLEQFIAVHKLGEE